GGQKCRAAAVGAAGVYETVVSLVRRVGHWLDDRDRRAGGRQPCSQSLGVCGWSAKSGVLQIGQHPSWALSSHRWVLVICRTDRLLRRAQYSASSGSSGDARCQTVWCRTMLVQENLWR